MTATLRDVIDALSRCDRDKPVRLTYEAGGVPCYIELPSNRAIPCDRPRLEVVSYRGYYPDASIEPYEGDMPLVGALHDALVASIGQEMLGYKGGTYYVDERLPLWCAGYGDASGDQIVGAEDVGGWVNLLMRKEGC